MKIAEILLQVMEDNLVDLSELAARLDADDRIIVKYRFPVRSAGGNIEYEIRTDRLLDVAEEAKLLYVSHAGEVIWIKQEEVIEVNYERA